jgi:hypothetical protein
MHLPFGSTAWFVHLPLFNSLFFFVIPTNATMTHPIKEQTRWHIDDD